MRTARRAKPILDAFGPMGLTVMGERGQVVVPKEIRDALGLKAGARLVAFAVPHGKLVLAPVEDMRRWMEDVGQRFDAVLKRPNPRS